MGGTGAWGNGGGGGGGGTPRPPHGRRTGDAAALCRQVGALQALIGQLRAEPADARALGYGRVPFVASSLQDIVAHFVKR